jgi:hypothetical protein
LRTRQNESLVLGVSFSSSFFDHCHKTSQVAKGAGRSLWPPRIRGHLNTEAMSYLALLGQTCHAWRSHSPFGTFASLGTRY